MHQPIRVLIRHADPLIAVGATAALADHPGFVVLPARTDTEVMATGAVVADMVVADVLVADHDSALAWLGDSPSPRTGVLVLSGRDGEAEISLALQRGARGYLLGPCSLEELVAAVRSVGSGRRYLCTAAAQRMARSMMCTPLTSRETDVLRLLALGLPNKRIASRLAIAVGTVKAHIRAILAKLEASSRTEATAIAEQRGLLGTSVPLTASGTRHGCAVLPRVPRPAAIPHLHPRAFASRVTSASRHPPAASAV